MKGKILLRTYINPTRLKFLAIGIVLIFFLAGLIYFMTPNPVGITAAFILLFSSCYFLSAFIFNRLRQDILIASGITTYFLLRFLDLRHSLYLVLLIALLISLELYFKKD